jgi:hypothetical protein
MEISTRDLKSRPTVNFSPGILSWMTKLSNEELKKWEDSSFERAKKMFEEQNREYRQDEAMAYVRDEARLIERDYTLF